MYGEKRVSDWTLADCKQYCEDHRRIQTIYNMNGKDKHICCTGDCLLQSKRICVCQSVLNMDLYSLTEEEKNIMRSVGARFVTKDNHIVRLWENDPRCDFPHITTISESLFPSVSDGDRIELDES